MSQQEYLSRLMSEQPKVVARNKTKDQSQQVFIVQARASSQRTSVVASNESVDGKSTVVYHASVGNGTNNDYSAILMGAAKCAICADPDPSVAAFQILPSSISDHSLPPWSQQDPAKPYSNCSVPPNNYFFPSKLSAVCSTNQIRYPFPS